MKPSQCSCVSSISISVEIINSYNSQRHQTGTHERGGAFTDHLLNYAVIAVFSESVSFRWMCEHWVTVCEDPRYTGTRRAGDEAVFSPPLSRKGVRRFRSCEMTSGSVYTQTTRAKKKQKTTPSQPFVPHPKGDKTAVTPFCLTSSHLEAQKVY